MFVERMRREGREQEWYSTVKAVRADREARGDSAGFSQSTWEAMRKLGYEGPKQERALYEEYLKREAMGKLRAQIKAEQDEIREEQKAENFEQAVKMLPDHAPTKVEIDWIRAHPAMARRARAKNNIDPVLIDVDDILCPPHGRAPSKSAVHQLQHWANSPNEFFKQLLAEQKKATGDEAAAKVVEDDLSEVEQLLKTVRAGSAADAAKVASAKDGALVRVE